MKLREIAHSRTGDKGNISNISLIAYRKEDYGTIVKNVTPEKVKEYFADVVKGKVVIYQLPNLWAINIVMYDALGGGVTRSLSLDTHGKSLSSLLLDMEIDHVRRLRAIYYLITALVSFIAAGGVDPDLPVSFGMACMYAFAATGVAMLVSCVLKKASTATIITFVLLLAVMPAFSMVLSMAGADASWMMDQAGAAITNCSDSYRDMTNEAIEGLAQSLSDPTQYFDVNLLMESLRAWGFSGTINDLGAVLAGSFNLTEIGSVISSMQVSAPDIPFDVGVLAVWGLASMAAGFFLFLRREF